MQRPSIIAPLSTAVHWWSRWGRRSAGPMQLQLSMAAAAAATAAREASSREGLPAALWLPDAPQRLPDAESVPTRRARPTLHGSPAPIEERRHVRAAIPLGETLARRRRRRRSLGGLEVSPVSPAEAALLAERAHRSQPGDAVLFVGNGADVDAKLAQVHWRAQGGWQAPMRPPAMRRPVM